MQETVRKLTIYNSYKTEHITIDNIEVFNITDKYKISADEFVICLTPDSKPVINNPDLYNEASEYMKSHYKTPHHKHDKEFNSKIKNELKVVVSATLMTLHNPPSVIQFELGVWNGFNLLYNKCHYYDYLSKINKLNPKICIRNDITGHDYIFNYINKDSTIDTNYLKYDKEKCAYIVSMDDIGPGSFERDRPIGQLYLSPTTYIQLTPQSHSNIEEIFGPLQLNLDKNNKIIKERVVPSPADGSIYEFYQRTIFEYENSLENIIKTLNTNFDKLLLKNVLTHSLINGITLVNTDGNPLENVEELCQNTTLHSILEMHLTIVDRNHEWYIGEYDRSLFIKMYRKYI